MDGLKAARKNLVGQLREGRWLFATRDYGNLSDFVSVGRFCSSRQS